MTVTEVERLSRMLTEMRVESSAQFARLDERLSAVPQLTARVTVLEQSSSAVGRFTWADVFRVAAAGAAIVSMLYVATHWNG